MYLYIVHEYLIALIEQCSNKSCHIPHVHGPSQSEILVLLLAHDYVSHKYGYLKFNFIFC